MKLTRALPPRVSRPWVVVAVAVWVLAFAYHQNRALKPLPAGPFSGEVRLRTDVFDGRWGQWALGEASEGVLLVDFAEPIESGRGDLLVVKGNVKGDPGTASGRGYRATIVVDRVLAVYASAFPPHIAGRAIRAKVVERLEPFDDSRALLAGFLIGDTSMIDQTDIDAMRRSGLSHFVAVSGSNVALFLGLLFVVTGPLALGPRRRAVIGLTGLPLYAAATRFEPSVMRASVMAGIALVGRLLGVVLEAWQLLSLAVATLLVFEPGLTTNVGFQLSVAATAGVLIGARIPVNGWVGRALAITSGAQLAVAPLLMYHFGSVPVMSPLVNLVAAPLVTLSTLLGAIGVGGATFLVGPAAWAAGLVLGLARGAAGWPQIGPWALTGMIAAAVMVWRLPRLREPAVVALAIVALTGVLVPGERLRPGDVVVLDVGQGDSILIHGGDGRFALVDGGPEESVVLGKLREYGVRSLELVILSHVHADHATGLIGLVGRLGIGEVWATTEPHQTEASSRLFAALGAAGIEVRSPSLGERRRLGALTITVAAPSRRYASPNDQSLVVLVEGASRTMLLSGDIETFAQADLRRLRADVLKVPHQGAATSDPEWLAGVGADLAIISVGPNDFGHPADWVITTLEQAGAEVRRTDEWGDVIVGLS